MRIIHLTFLYSLLSVYSTDPASEYLQPSRVKIVKSTDDSPATINAVEPGAANIIYQSKDGGKTWLDISEGLPANEPPEDFFAGESDLYLRLNDEMYRSKSTLKTPVWERDNVLDPRCGSIAFNRSGIMAYNYEGLIYQNMAGMGTWVPVYTNFKGQSMRTVFETSDGNVFLGCDSGLYKSSDHGQTWKRVLDEGWVMKLVESNGVLVGTSQRGIIRSMDNGEHWERVISEGGVGIAIEKINGGFAAIAANTSTETRRIHLSFDNGKTWKVIDGGLPHSLFISSIKQMGQYLICGHPDGIFRSSDMGKTWIIVHPPVEYTFKVPGNISNNNPGKVFNIHASGNVLYAVAKSAGC